MGKSRCKHLNVSIGETTPRHMLHVFENGKRVESIGGEYGSTSKFYSVVCRDCGLEKDFNTWSKSCPKWVNDRVQQITNPELPE